MHRRWKEQTFSVSSQGRIKLLFMFVWFVCFNLQKTLFVESVVQLWSCPLCLPLSVITVLRPFPFFGKSSRQNVTTARQLAGTDVAGPELPVRQAAG